MKVLHICSYYITSQLYKNLISNLDKIDVYNDVYIPINSEDLRNKFCPEGLEKANFIYSKCFNKIDRVNFKFKNKKIYNDLPNSVNLNGVDLVHAHSLFVNGYVAYKLKKEKNIDYIVAIRNTDANVFFKNMIHLRKIGIEIIKNAKHVIFISPQYKKMVIEKYIPSDMKKSVEEKSIVIPNGIDPFWFENMKMTPRKLDKKRLNLIYVGRLEKIKNVDTTMAVIKRLNEMGYNASLDIVGKGSQLSKIKKQIESKYKGLVNLHGFKSKEELIDLYQKSDIFIMPSKHETFGLVYIEAISQGLPVIYTKDEGIYGYFEEGEVGYGVKYNNIDEIANKIVDMVHQKEWNLSKFEDRLNKSFRWNNIANQYKEIYTSVVEDKDI